MGEEKKEEEATTIIKVGKLGKNVYNPKPEDVKESQSENMRIGKINTDNLFKEAEENSEELLNICKPGKLSEDKLTFANDEEKDVDREDDTHVVPSGKVSERTNAFESKPGKSEQKLSPVLRRSESNLTSDMQKKYQQQVARNQSLRREKSDVVVVSVQDGKISDARNSFFQSMMTNTSSSSSSRLGTSILPTGLDSSSKPEVHKTSSRKGKDLFKRCAEKQEESFESLETITTTTTTSTSQESTVSSSSSQMLPGVDFEEIEDEFEKLHREMMKETD